MTEDSVLQRRGIGVRRGQRETNDERLMRLFQNRAELKKEFSGLREERDHLLDRIKEKESEVERAEQRLKSVEQLLTDRESGYNAMVYFQLHELWDQCNARLRQFAEDLMGQQRDRERKKQIMEFNQARQARLQQLNADVLAVKSESDQFGQHIKEMEQRRDAQGGVFNIFKRRRMQQSIDEQQRQHLDIRARIEDLFDKRIKLESEPWPEYPGLSIEGKRVINIAVVAMAQHLYVQYSENNLSSMARTAKLKDVTEVRFGTRDECEHLMNMIRRALHTMSSHREDPDELKARANDLRNRAQYRNESDTVPLANSIDTIPIGLKDEELRRTMSAVPLEVNILADEYWDVQAVFLH